jgi:ubiquinone/menaquinone biosynthesis C-methylase UbiE
MTSADYYESNKRSFHKLAPFYNLIASPVARVRDKVVRLSGAKAGATILDVCTGTGSQAMAFGRKGYNVTGVDISADMLNIAVKRNRFRNVRFEIADATSLPFQDKLFAVSTISLALHDMPREVRPKVLEEMKRVSHRMVVVDYHIPDNKVERWLYISFTSLYELGYYHDFARQNLKELIQHQGLKIIQEAYGLRNFIKIFVCDT